ncbi:MAG: hypothetical protein K2J35_01405, partial [Eubacterium sp.]|nr:hypothetical protein [Eubacterium sp.]
FMHEPQVAFENCEFIYYRSPNTEVEQDEESSLYGSEVVYPTEELKTQYFKNLPQNIIELQNNLWTQVKSGKLSDENAQQDKKIYTECAVIGGVIVVVIIAKAISNAKKKKEQDLSDLYEH